jgi:K(+)-stimulated pyrophosphate-energized sodium pump
VALNPVIKFTTLFGLLAVELAVSVRLTSANGPTLTGVLAAVFFVVSAFFVYRSFYGMRIEKPAAVAGERAAVGSAH